MFRVSGCDESYAPDQSRLLFPGVNIHLTPKWNLNTLSIGGAQGGGGSPRASAGGSRLPRSWKLTSHLGCIQVPRQNPTRNKNTLTYGVLGQCTELKFGYKVLRHAQVPGGAVRIVTESTPVMNPHDRLWLKAVSGSGVESLAIARIAALIRPGDARCRIQFHDQGPAALHSPNQDCGQLRASLDTLE